MIKEKTRQSNAMFLQVSNWQWLPGIEGKGFQVQRCAMIPEMLNYSDDQWAD